MARKKLFGLDLFDVIVHVVVTIATIALITNANPGPDGEAAGTGVFIGSVLLFAWRRKRALAAQPEPEAPNERMEDLEYRVADLEQAQQRILELEERLDFAERLLTRREAESLPQGRDRAT